MHSAAFHQRRASNRHCSGHTMRSNPLAHIVTHRYLRRQQTPTPTPSANASLSCCNTYVQPPNPPVRPDEAAPDICSDLRPSHVQKQLASPRFFPSRIRDQSRSTVDAAPSPYTLRRQTYNPCSKNRPPPIHTQVRPMDLSFPCASTTCTPPKVQAQANQRTDGESATTSCVNLTCAVPGAPYFDV